MKTTTMADQVQILRRVHEGLRVDHRPELFRLAHRMAEDGLLNEYLSGLTVTYTLTESGRDLLTDHVDEAPCT
jgi:DNA-binding PadR family transcriptional regulator